MNKKILLACLATVAISAAQAAEITFLNPQFDVTTIATTTDGPASFDSQTSPPSATPIFASSDSVGATDVATAGAIGGPGLLSTSADATAVTGIATSVALAHFAGSFVLPAAQPFVVVDFTPLTFEVGSSNAATTLFIRLVTGATTVFADFVSGSWAWGVTPGATYLLDLTLGSEANAGFAPAGTGNAFASGSVTITSAVPLPAAWILFLVGLGPVAFIRRRLTRGMAAAS
ncbi:MAG TPA: hypothetical protein VHM00_16765 [Caldimonas sp.]|nr:hypothetical protein [Caldimonas sp.]HEX2542724.1 hypothetical protein [Caldimonas sp.]